MFFIGEENEADSNLLRIPLEGSFKSRNNLVSAVIATFSSLSTQGKPEFLKAAQEEAEMMKVPYERYISMIVEHQICIRSGGLSGGLCYSSGVGDKLHSYAEALDRKVARAPKILQKVYAKAASAALSVVNQTPVKTNKIGGCSSCRGRKSFSAKGKNMGRAGRMQ